MTLYTVPELFCTVAPSVIERMSSLLVNSRLAAGMTLDPSGMCATRLHQKIAALSDPKKRRAPVKKKFPIDPFLQSKGPSGGGEEEEEEEVVDSWIFFATASSKY